MKRWFIALVLVAAACGSAPGPGRATPGVTASAEAGATAGAPLTLVEFFGGA
jgi:precorrin-3B methylase